MGQPYLKDWHCVAALDEAAGRADAPALYAAQPGLLYDWLNAYCSVRRRGHGDDDFFFLYAGGAGSWTPLHCDVVGSLSWSTNLAGLCVFGCGCSRRFGGALVARGCERQSAPHSFFLTRTQKMVALLPAACAGAAQGHGRFAAPGSL